MLHIATYAKDELGELGRKIAADLQGRELIAIRARLFTLMIQFADQRWQFPALRPTEELLHYRVAMKTTADAASIPGNVYGSPINGKIMAKLLGNIAQGTEVAGLTTYFSGLTRDYYGNILRRIEDELALRGYPPSTL